MDEMGSEVDDRVLFAVEDAHGDVLRVMEWGEAVVGDGTIGCIQFSDEDGEDGEDGPTVHLLPVAALQLGEKLVEWAKSRGA